MTGVQRSIVAVALATVALTLAAPAQAGPDCTDIGPNTRMCTRAPGHTAITTSPDPIYSAHQTKAGPITINIASPRGAWGIVVSFPMKVLYPRNSYSSQVPV